MDFFKSVFADDPDPPSSPPSDSHSPNHPSETLTSDNSPESPDQSTPQSPFSAAIVGGGGWSFGGLMQTISSRSESVLETYRRDLEEFTSGLKSETEVLKHVASSSLDISASKAQVSLESVGRAVDVVWKSTTDIISHGKESLLAHDLDSTQSESPRTAPLTRDHSLGSLSNQNVRYSRFEAQLRAIQSDVNTYVEEVEDGKEEFEKWKLGFDLGEYEEEVEKVMGENGGVVDAIYRKVVPSVVDRETFWLRYFYRVHRLKQAEFVRAKLVKRAMKEEDEEEELSWDVDDDEGGDAEGSNANVDANASVNEKENENAKALARDVANVVVLEGEKEEKAEKEEGDAQIGGNKEVDEKDGVVEAAREEVLKEDLEEDEKGEVKEGEMSKKGEEKVASESGKDSDISVVSSQPSHDEEDMGWDEIEDIDSGDEKKVSQLGSPNRAELRKRLSAAEDDEDLSWDIEDDDEPIKH